MSGVCEFFTRVLERIIILLPISEGRMMLKENVIRASEVASLQPHVDYGNSSPRVWERISLEGGMYHSKMTPLE